MPKKDPRVTAYIARSAPFARPILRHLRAVIHAGCPRVTENIKWGMPSFEYHGNLCFVAAFKAHAGMVFWKGGKVVPAGATVRGAMGHFGRLTSVADLPSRSVLVGYVKKAAAINETKAKLKARAPKSRTAKVGARAKAGARRSPARRTAGR